MKMRCGGPIRIKNFRRNNLLGKDLITALLQQINHTRAILLKPALPKKFKFKDTSVYFDWLLNLRDLNY